ncbi:hypothetical protein IGI04_015159 [Brassica rapa subsp. trilocularis]|uniref:DUF1985 domain-containing protein n=1 Tax=Brassica rapa subsp. trilocularis TaxID=1813537 RepID=A0ABQ7MPE3_BRACM|nr:hypothetical protein IGI04_015159 [Brassica rapa subsp. trilocularis]
MELNILFATCMRSSSSILFGMRVNNYFNLRWIKVIKSALEDENLAMLNASQFGRVLKMGSHTFFVMFVHYLLSRQLVTENDFELQWFFVGKPIRYAIQDIFCHGTQLWRNR